MRPAIAVVATAMALGIAGCGGNSDGGRSTCSEVFAARPETPAEFESGASCVDDEGEQWLVASASKECSDGRTLIWNDYGAGFIGEPWHPEAADVNGAEATQMRVDCGL